MSHLLFYSIATFFILCTSAYINHRMFKNSKNFLGALIWCAVFTTGAEFSIANTLNSLEKGTYAWFLIHLLVWSLWIIAMILDNWLQDKIDKIKKED